MKKFAYIIVIGKPGSGKSWICDKISKEYGMELVAPNIVRSESSDIKPWPTEESSNVSSGNDEESPVSPVKWTAPKATHYLKESIARSIIIDGSLVTECLWSLADIVQTFRDFFVDSHMLYIFNLQIDDHVLISRRLTQFLDPLTGLIYREEQQISTAMKFRIGDEVVAGQDSPDDTPDPNDSNMPFNFPKLVEVTMTASELDEIIEFKDSHSLKQFIDSYTPSDDAMVKKLELFNLVLRNMQVNESMKKPTVWNVTSRDVKMRLKKRSNDNKSSIAQDLRSYNDTIASQIDALRNELPQKAIVDVLADETPISILGFFSTWFSHVGSRIFTMNTAADPIELLPSSMPKMLSVNEILPQLLKQVTNDMPLLLLPNVNTYCVVNYVDNGRKVPGDPAFAFSYMGYLFLLSSEDSVAKFKEQPQKYYYGAQSSTVFEPFAVDHLQPPCFDFKFIFGEFGNFCPVSYARGLYRIGKPEIAASYGQKYYLFQSKEDRSNFMSSPSDFIEKARDQKIPPRIAVCGLSKSCNHEIIAAIRSLMPDMKVILSAHGVDNTIGYVMDGLSDLYGEKLPDIVPDFIINVAISEDKWVLLNDGSATFDQMTGRLDEVLKRLRSNGIEIIEISGTAGTRQMLKAVKPHLNRLITRRELIFTPVQEIDRATAFELLEARIVDTSSFGKYCPVTLNSKNKCASLSQSFGSIPCIFRGSVYFCRDSEAVKAFSEDPFVVDRLLLSSQLFTPIYSIFGPSILISRVATILDLRIISAGDIPSELNENTTFSRVIQALIPAGRGALFDLNSFKSSPDLVSCICDISWKIAVVYDVSKEPEFNCKPKSIFVDSSIHPCRSVCLQFSAHSCARYRFLAAVEHGAAVFCDDVGLTEESINNAVSDIGLFCPVSLTDDNDWLMGSDPKLNLWYRGKIYRVIDSVKAYKFIANPDVYTASLKPPLDTPRRVLNWDASKVALKGYCAVSLSKGTVIAGDPKFLADYQDRVFCLAGEDAFHEFMKSPWKYANFEIGRGIAPAFTMYETVQILEFSQFYEQVLSGIINQGLLHLSYLKPVNRLYDPRRAATTFMYLFFKANNPNTCVSSRSYFKKLVEAFSTKFGMESEHKDQRVE